MPFRRVARAARENRESLLEPGEQRLGREHLRAGRRELDRERETVETPADLPDRVGPADVGVDRGGALHEEIDRVRLRQRRDDVLMLAPRG